MDEDLKVILELAGVIPEIATDREITMADRMWSIHQHRVKAANALRAWIQTMRDRQ